MNRASNGVSITETNRDGWVIVGDGQVRYIGSPTEDLDSTVTNWINLCPAFEYHSGIVLSQTATGVNIGRQRFVVPIESMASRDVRITIRRGHWYRLSDFDKPDREIIEREIDNAIKGQEQLRAQRSGLSLVSELPKGLPPVSGRS